MSRSQQSLLSSLNWLANITALVLLLTVLHAMLMMFFYPTYEEWQSKAIPYWLIVLQNWIILLLVGGLVLAAILLLLLGIIYFLFIPPEQVLRRVRFYCPTLLLLVIFIPVYLALAGPIVIDDLQHVDSLSYGTHRYQLAFETSIIQSEDVGSRFYIFYECDRFGLICHPRQKFTRADLGISSIQPSLRKTIKLAIQSQPDDKSAIVIEVNDEVMYTFVPD